MPNRILKDGICRSANIDSLSLGAETFFYRLMVQCDDYGRFDARRPVLRAYCYPLRLNTVTDEQISTWLDELVAADLIWLYTDGEGEYVQIAKWDKHQQIRAQRSKYPAPISGDIACDQVPADAPVNESNPIQSESESNPIPPRASVPPPLPLTPGQQLFKERWGMKRINTEQLAAIKALETQYGLERLTEGVVWAREKSMTFGQSIGSIRTALKNWGKSKSSPNGSKPNARNNPRGRDSAPASNRPTPEQLKRDLELKAARDARLRDV